MLENTAANRDPIPIKAYHSTHLLTSKYSRYRYHVSRNGLLRIRMLATKFSCFFSLLNSCRLEKNCEHSITRIGKVTEFIN